MLPQARGRLDGLRDAPLTHLAVGALVCLFVLSPALFSPWGFGPDYTNHLWLVWQQGLAISDGGHPTVYLQTPGAIFQPFYGFYGGTLYGAVGAVSALFGNHAYPVYVASIGLAAALAYGGMWWLGRQLGLGRWAAHLPAFVVVTAAYYLTDAYARGAWPELVALSAVPMFIAGAARLLTGPWRAGPVALFVLATVVLTGSHNITLFWSVVVLGPVAVALWLVAGDSRPSLRRLLAVAALAVVAVGINAWFLLLDLAHAGDVQAWINNEAFMEAAFGQFFYFNNLGTLLNPLRHFPAQSSTFGLVIAAPVAAFGLSLALTALAWPQLRRSGRPLVATWLILLAAMAALVVLVVMPESWWLALGAPFTNIQFPYRLAGWLLIAVAIQLAISLRFARDLSGVRRRLVAVLAAGLVVLTVAQAAAQLYDGPRVDGLVNEKLDPHQAAFANGPTGPPDTFYDPFSYADASLPVIEPPEERTIFLPTPAPGQDRLTEQVGIPPGRGPVASNIGAGPYVVRVEGMKVVGRTPGGALVLQPPAHGREAIPLTVVADTGTLGTVGTVISLLCLAACFCLVVGLATDSWLRYRRRLHDGTAGG